MFTGIIEELGVVKAIARGSASAVLHIGCSRVLEETKIGDSIAVNGVCLTIRQLEPEAFAADVMAETLTCTVLGQLQPGSIVNLERALRLQDRLGGHIVTGHVDCVGRITRQQRQDIALLTEIAAAEQFLRYLVPKGSVAVDGISLTVVELTAGGFTVSLIPHTAVQTTLGSKSVGDSVNLETDIMAKYAARLLNSRLAAQETLDYTFLAENGFI